MNQVPPPPVTGVTDLPNPNQLERWIVPAPYAVRFVVDTGGKLMIEFASGREREVHQYLAQHIDFNLSQKEQKIAALKAEADRNRMIETARVQRDDAMGVVQHPIHQPEAPTAPRVDTSAGNPLAGLDGSKL